MDKSPILIGSIRKTPLGEVWVAFSEYGLVAVEFGVSRAVFEASVRKQTRRDIKYILSNGARSLREAPQWGPTSLTSQISSATRQIKEYLTGQRRAFDLKIDWSVLGSDFQRAALRTVLAIPYGKTRTYAEVAAKIGYANAPRAVGRANATNPMPLVIPCHRVIGTDGKLHGYGGKGGLKTKAWLLKLEGANRLTVFAHSPG
jgi:methylated-DNA-[protein]-cysteine S-methyltransferase